MQKIFAREIRFKDDQGKDFPEWEVRHLGDIYQDIRNGFVGTATPFYRKFGVLYLQGKNIKEGKIQKNGFIFISDSFHKKNRKSQLKFNDIVVVQSGHVGECALITKEFEGANCHALIIMTTSLNIQSAFYVYYFYSNIGRSSIHKKKTGNTIEHILSSDMKTIEVPLPSLAEQQKIADFLSAIDQKIETGDRQLEKLKEWKKGLLQQLFV